MTYFLLAISALLLGALLTWFVTNKQKQQRLLENARLLDKATQLSAENIAKTDQLNKLESKLLALSQESENNKIQQAKAETELHLLYDKLSAQQQWLVDLETSKTRINDMEKDAARMEENLIAEREKIAAQQRDFTLQKEQLSSEFRLLANEILEEKSSKFAAQSKKDIGELIDPMKEKIEQFKKQVSDAYHEDERERFSLKNEIKHLLDLNKNLSQEAHNLSRALKGDNKTQGDWGEMILETILENSGLTKGREYFVQMSITNDDNKRYRPDVVVKYPGNRCVVIDAKVSLKSYEAYVSAKDSEEQKTHLKAHIDSVKRHIKELTQKNYQDLFPDCKSPDFVMMFMPIEPAYMLALQNDAELWNNAYTKQILLISPTNLIAALRMIAELWEHDKQNKNVLRIAEESGKMVDKFIGFLEDFDRAGELLKKSGEAFDKARSKIKDGRGNIVDKAKLITKLGAASKKALPQPYLELDDE